MTDPLDGFRGTPLVLAKKIEHAKPDDELWDRLYLGDAAKKIMLGVASSKDIAKVMANMIAQCEVGVQQSAKNLLTIDDPGSPEGRQQHLLAKIEASILGRMNQLINEGIVAADAINNHEET
jgi:hypothetical protein